MEKGVVFRQFSLHLEITREEIIKWMHSLSTPLEYLFVCILLCVISKEKISYLWNTEKVSGAVSVGQ